MADILSQDEVDLLLNAVASGEVEVEETDYATDEGRVLTVYDFRRPERVSKEQLKGLQSLFEAFAREVSIAMPPFLRTVVRVDLVSIDQLTYDEFILSIARPTSLAIVNMSPLEGNGVLELNPNVVFPIVDRVLGGPGSDLDHPRELTEIENRIMHRILMIVLDCWKRSWEHLIDFNLRVVAQESDPLIVQIVAGQEMVILVSYEFHVGSTVGGMNMCVPLMVLNPILDQISQQSQLTRKMPEDMAARVRDALVKTVLRARVPVDALVGRTVLPLREIAALKVGDIVQLDAPAKLPIPVEVGGIERFRATPGRVGQQSAVQLGRLVRD